MSSAEQEVARLLTVCMEEIVRGKREAYAAAAALCRETGCVCKHLYAAYGADDSLEWNGRFRTTGTLDGLVTMGEIEIHDPRCPDALAARIEALGKTEPQSGGR